MTRIVAYTWEADVHCVACTRKRFFTLHRDAPPPWCPHEIELDEHGVPTYAVDGEGNLVRPVFSTDEFDFSGSCGTCREPINLT